MTTIAFDGETIAADFRQVSGFICNLNCQKIYKIGTAFIGCAGAAEQEYRFIRWFKDQTKPRPDSADMKEFEAMVIRGGKVYQVTDLCEFTEVGYPFSIGSGCNYAMGAMYAGADSRQAVKISSRLDPYTGGKIKAMKVK